MDYLEAQTILDPLPPPRRNMPLLPEFTSTPVEHFERKFGEGGGGSVEGAFYTIYTEDDDDYLLAGTVSGSAGGSVSINNHLIITEAEKLNLAEDPPVPLPDSGKILYVKADCEAIIEDGIMLPGLKLTGASLQEGASVPANHQFTVSAPTGSIYFEVGRWTDTEFLRSGPPGNLATSSCLGNFILYKV